MTSLNKAYFIGHLGRTPELRSTAAGTKVASISLATRASTRVDGQYVEQTEWHRLTAQDSIADHLATRKKGDMVAVECTIRPMKWTDKDDKTHHEVAFVIERVLWCSTPPVAPKLGVVTE